MSDATTIKNIDNALVSRYSGISIGTGDPQAPTAVEVFMEIPDPEEATERTYPSIAIQFIGIAAGYEMTESDDFEDEEISYNPTLDPPERAMRVSPLPYRVAYSIDTWHKARVGESRDLVSEAMIARTQPRDFIALTTIDAGTFDADLMWSGGIVNSDQLLPDVVIYHKSLTIEVAAYLSLVEANALTPEKVVTTNQWTVFQNQVAYDKSGRVQEVTGQIKDVTFNITDDGVVVDDS